MTYYSSGTLTKMNSYITTPLTGSGGVSKVFEDVTEIPAIPDSNLIYRVKVTPNPVPNDGSLIETVYFNTSLTVSEVVEKVNSYNIPWVDGAAFGSSSLELYPICMFDGSSFDIFNNDPYVVLIIARPKADHNHVVITFACFGTEEFVDVFVSDDGGWYSYPHISLNKTSTTSFQGLTMGTHNALITDLVSTTDFGQKTKYYNYDGTNTNQINETISIIKKTFTDRPTLYEWLLGNHWKVINTIIELTMFGKHTLTSLGCITDSSSAVDDNPSFGLVTGYNKRGTNTEGSVTTWGIDNSSVNSSSLSWDLQNPVDEVVAGFHIQDNDWDGLNMSITVYYLE